MTKKTDLGSGMPALETVSDESDNVRSFDSKASRQKNRTTIRRRSGLPKIDFQQSRASYHFMDRMQGYGLKPLRLNELKSIYALFAWVANEQGASEETVQSITETQFRVKDVINLQQKDYDEVIKFLVDLRIDEMRH